MTGPDRRTLAERVADVWNHIDTHIYTAIAAFVTVTLWLDPTGTVEAVGVTAAFVALANHAYFLRTELYDALFIAGDRSTSARARHGGAK